MSYDTYHLKPISIEKCRKKSRAKLFFVIGRFGRLWGPMEVIEGRLYAVWEVYEDPMGVIGVI